MALIECPECKKIVSNTNNLCPNCGYPLNTKEIKNENYNDVKSKTVDRIANFLIKFLIIIAIFVACVVLFAISNNSKTKGKGWEVISKSEYVRDNKKCMGYRVYLSENKTYKEKQAIFEDITSHSSYYLHTVWFYSTKSGANGSGTYDMGMMEQTYKGEKPIVKH